METIQDILAKKGSQVWSIDRESSVFDALTLMNEKNVGALLVTDSSGKPEGIFSERDYARKTINKIGGKDCPRDLPVRDLMTKDLIFIKAETGIETCMALMTKKRVRHLPVKTGDNLSGMVSIGDIVKAVIDEKDFLIARMEQYIWDN